MVQMQSLKLSADHPSCRCTCWCSYW